MARWSPGASCARAARRATTQRRWRRRRRAPRWWPPWRLRRRAGRRAARRARHRSARWPARPRPRRARGSRVGRRLEGRRRDDRRRRAARCSSSRSECDEEEPIVAVDLRGTDGLAHDRHDAGAVLADRLGDELLEPEPEGGRLRVKHERDLVATRAHDRPPVRLRGAGPGWSLGLRRGRTRRSAASAPSSSERGVSAGEQRRDDAEVRQRRVATSDVGPVVEHLGEATLVGQRGEIASPGR